MCKDKSGKVEECFTRDLTISHGDIKECRVCHANAERIQFKGYLDLQEERSTCSHYYSEPDGNGWWLRIDHHYDFFDQSYEDHIGAIMCPSCCEESAKRFKEIMNETEASAAKREPEVIMSEVVFEVVNGATIHRVIEVKTDE